MLYSKRIGRRQILESQGGWKSVRGGGNRRGEREKTEERQKRYSERGLGKVLCEWEKECQDQQHQTY